MHRTTTRLCIQFAAMLALTALTLPATIPASGGEQGAAVGMGDETPAPPTPVTPPRAPRAPRAAPAPAEVPTPAPPIEVEEAPELMIVRPEGQSRPRPRGRFGFAFDCDGCYAKPAGSDSAPVWTFPSRPRVDLVEAGSPAARAGFRRGDVITRVDGASILSPEGGRRFGATLPGQTVRWTVLRDGEPRELVATAIEPPGGSERKALRDISIKVRRLNEVSDMEELRRQLRELNRQMDQLRRQEQNRTRTTQARPRPLRYGGVVGNTKVEVRGASTVMISETLEKDKLVIELGESVVVIQVAESAPKKKDSPK